MSEESKGNSNSVLEDQIKELEDRVLTLPGRYQWAAALEPLPSGLPSYYKCNLPYKNKYYPAYQSGMLNHISSRDLLKFEARNIHEHASRQFFLNNFPWEEPLINDLLAEIWCFGRDNTPQLEIAFHRFIQQICADIARFKETAEIFVEKCKEIRWDEAFYNENKVFIKTLYTFLKHPSAENFISEKEFFPTLQWYLDQTRAPDNNSHSDLFKNTIQYLNNAKVQEKLFPNVQAVLNKIAKKNSAINFNHLKEELDSKNNVKIYLKAIINSFHEGFTQTYDSIFAKTANFSFECSSSTSYIKKRSYFSTAIYLLRLIQSELPQLAATLTEHNSSSKIKSFNELLTAVETECLKQYLTEAFTDIEKRNAYLQKVFEHSNQLNVDFKQFKSFNPPPHITQTQPRLKSYPSGRTRYSLKHLMSYFFCGCKSSTPSAPDEYTSLLNNSSINGTEKNAPAPAYSYAALQYK